MAILEHGEVIVTANEVVVQKFSFDDSVDAAKLACEWAIEQLQQRLKEIND